MLVTDIEISRYDYCTELSRHTASVYMSLKSKRISLFCRLGLPRDENPGNRAIAFVVEATRQVLRMPEYRSGSDKLQFSELLSGMANRQMTRQMA